MAVPNGEHPCSSKSENLNTEDVNALMSEGKRHYLCQESLLAYKCFEEASSLLAARYGQAASECGEAYLYYGKSLLDLARMEGDVLGSAIKEEEQPDDCRPEKEEHAAADSEECDDHDSDANSDQGSVKNDDDCGDEEQEDDDVPNMQLAWEMIELAKSIFARSKEHDNEARLGDCHAGLGEISLELEHYEAAVEDFLACLAIREKHLEKDDRQIAEINYSLGLSYMFSKEFDAAVKNFSDALEGIQLRAARLGEAVSKLEFESSGKKKANPNSDIEKLRKEIDELDGLIPDITAKIDDAHEMKKSNESTVAAVKEMAKHIMGGVSNSFDVSAFPDAADEAVSAPPASDITHLIRKKRPSADDQEAATDAKRSKTVTTEAVAGARPANADADPQGPLDG